MDPKILFPFAVNKHREKIIAFDTTHAWGYQSGEVEYIDLSLGSCGCLPLGFKRKDFFVTVQKELEGFSFLSGEFLTTNNYVVELAEKLYELSNGYRSVFTVSGSDAIETAIKTAKHFQRNTRPLIVGFENSYHGSTYLSSSISGATYLHETYGRDANCRTVPWDLDAVEQLINQYPSQISCLVVESCSWQAGLHTFDSAWWQRLQTLCRHNGILFIIDDIAFCGGKTGRFFGFENNIQPDMICVGKALSGGYYPLSACLVSEDIYNVVKETRYFHGFTYSFNMSGILSTLHYLKVLENENVYDQYQHIKKEATTMFDKITIHKCIRNIRTYGSTWCLDINSGMLTDEDISELFLNNGLYLGIWNSSPSYTKHVLIHLPNIFDQDYFTQLEHRLNIVLEQLSDKL